MIGIGEAFSSHYAQARAKFLEAAAAAGLAIESHPHPLAGPRGEALALDVARDGPANAQRLLIVSSACHGVEGFCGSGVQVFALHDADWRAQAHAAGVAVLYLHALNPHGFAHLRRVTHENVDLNRNFPDFAQPLPANLPYGQVHALLLPGEWPPTPANKRAVQAYIAEHGEAAWQSAITRGQHTHADGLFYGGAQPTWSHRTLRTVLRQHARHVARVGWIDLHTGLGPSGVAECIWAGHDDAPAIARARRWWGQGITSLYDGSSSSAFLTGELWNSAYEECPQAEYTGIALEYGTVPLPDMLHALRADHWLHLHPEAPPALAAQIRQQIKDAFYVDADAWRGQVISQARQALFRAAQGLAA